MRVQCRHGLRQVWGKSPIWPLVGVKHGQEEARHQTACDWVSPCFFYNWEPAWELQPIRGYLEKRKPTMRAAGRARRHLQHQPEELSEESSTTRVLKGFSVRCHWVRMASLAPLHLPRPTSRYW